MKKLHLSILFACLFAFATPSYGLFIPPDQPQKTAFGENLVGQLYPQFQNSFEYTVDNTDLTENTVVNGGTITQSSAMAVISTSTTTSSSGMLESYRHAKYRSGIGGVARFTALFTSPVAGTEQYVGVMDVPGSSFAFRNGYSFGYTGTAFGIQRWSNDTLIAVDQSSWNVDTLGAGTKNPSGMTLIHTNLNVFQIRYQYLGAGAIRFFIEDSATGDFILVHMIKYANKYIEPSVHNPNFHFIMWAANKATASNIIVKSSSFGYFSEGRTTFIELHQPQNSSGLKQKTAVTTEVAIFTIRNKNTYASKSNFIDIFIENVLASIEASSANNLGSVRLIKNATLGGTPSYLDINTTNSVVEIDVAGTTVTGGKEIAVFPLAGKNDKTNFDLTPFRVILKHNETLTIAGKSANSATIECAALWRELF
jgi:hypothetical protein